MENDIMNEFIIERMLNNDKLCVRQKSTGWVYPNLSAIEAEELCKKLNEPYAPREQLTVDDYFKEWEKAIDELSEKELALINLKETYAQLEQEIVENTDFKELYGANNQKVRDNHIRNELKDLVDTKNDLNLRIDYLKRRIDFIKNIMAMQRTLLEVGVVE